MAGENIAQLSDRGIVSVTGSDARKLLQGLITNDMERLTAVGEAIHAALLTPQGKILFAFFVVQAADGFLLETNAASAKDLVKRLSMYRLRADVTISDRSADYRAFALWGGEAHAGHDAKILSFPDPREARLGYRLIVEANDAEDLPARVGAATASPAAYTAHRITLGIPEADADYPLTDTYPHEADFDLFDGVSFKKGCFVGQEVVARMQNKTVVRKRVVKVKGTAPLTSGAEITIGDDIKIGRIGSVDRNEALALLRLDRVVEAMEKNVPVQAGGTRITVDDAPLERFRSAARTGA